MYTVHPRCQTAIFSCSCSVFSPQSSCISCTALYFERSTDIAWPEAEFLDVIGYSSCSFALCYSQSPLLKDFTPSPPLFSKVFLNWFVMLTLYTQASRVWELSRTCPETATKLYVHKFGFSIHLCTQLAHVLEEPVWNAAGGGGMRMRWGKAGAVGCMCGEEAAGWDACAVRRRPGGMRVRWEDGLGGMRRRGKLGVGVALAWLGGMLYYVQISKQRVRTAVIHFRWSQ